MPSEFPPFPRAFMSTSREELTRIPLTVRDPKGQTIQLPEDLCGHVFIMAFAGTVASPRPVNPPDGAIPENTVMPASGDHTALFDGDGMVYRLDFHSTPGQFQFGQAWLTSRLIKPPAFFADKILYQDSKANPTYEDLRFWDLGFARLSVLGVSNQINTALAAIKYSSDSPARLIATNDASCPYEIDPCSLKVVAPVGSIAPSANLWKTYDGFTGVFPFILSSAHPCTDFSERQGVEQGEFFTVNVVKSLGNLFLHKKTKDSDTTGNQLFLIHWKLVAGEQKEPCRCEVRYLDQPIEILQSTHMLGITENHVIIADTAMKFEQIESSLMIIIQLLGLLLDSFVSAKEKAQNDVREIVKGLRVALRFEKIQIHSYWNKARLLFNKLPFVKYAFSRILPSMKILHRLQEYPVNTREKSVVDQTHSKTRHRKDNVWNFLIDKLIKRLRLCVSSMQNSNTILYIVDRSQLESVLDHNSNSEVYINAVKVDVPGPFAHFLADYDETDDGKIIAVAPMSYAFDAAEYITRFDRPKWSSSNIKDLAGMIPLGLDSNCPALLEIDPKSGGLVMHELNLPFDEDPIYIGLYTYRDDMPTGKNTDIYWLCGGAWPEMLTEFIYDLYRDYSPRRISLDDLKQKIQKGIPMEISHMKIDRNEIRGTSSNQPLNIVNKYIFPPGIMVFSIQFVPRKNSSDGDDGYLVCTIVHSDNLYSNSSGSSDKDWSDNSEIWIFDAQDIKTGPLYTLSHPLLNFGMTIHSVWLNDIAPSPPRNYSFNDDYREWITAFRQDDYPEFSDAQKELNDLFNKIDSAFGDYRNSDGA